jgi:hypothetical protein
VKKVETDDDCTIYNKRMYSKHVFLAVCSDVRVSISRLETMLDFEEKPSSLSEMVIPVEYLSEAYYISESEVEPSPKTVPIITSSKSTVRRLENGPVDCSSPDVNMYMKPEELKWGFFFFCIVFKHSIVQWIILTLM